MEQDDIDLVANLESRLEQLNKQITEARHGETCPYWYWDWRYSFDNESDCTCVGIEAKE